MNDFSRTPFASPPAASANAEDYLSCSVVWQPAVSVFRKMRFRPKAMVIAAAFLMPIALLAWNDFEGRTAVLRDTSCERDGVAFARSLLPAIKHARQLRRFTLAEAASGAATATALAMREKLAADIAVVKESDARYGGAFGTHEAVAALDAALKQAQPASAGVMPVFASHGKLSMALLSVLSAVSEVMSQDVV